VRRGVVDLVTGLALWMGRRRRVAVGPDPVRINLGSSLKVAPGWINVDAGLVALIAPLPRPLLRAAHRVSGVAGEMPAGEFARVLSEGRFVHHDLARGLPFPDGCAEAVFSSHFLEHVSRADGERILAECRRVLAPGGTVRVAVPDLAWLVHEFTEGRKRYAVDGIFEAGERGELARHRYMYDEELLGEAFAAAGFSDVRRRGFGEGRIPDLELLDNREGSLVMEATK
jgi:SAM-dependent methyltransferase